MCIGIAYGIMNKANCGAGHKIFTKVRHIGMRDGTHTYTMVRPNKNVQTGSTPIYSVPVDLVQFRFPVVATSVFLILTSEQSFYLKVTSWASFGTARLGSGFCIVAVL
uniref:Uncharacterized protein n=1 Tax=Arundo donax TaxID=35708 RepID=A0A0A9HRE2_ARUDO